MNSGIKINRLFGIVIAAAVAVILTSNVGMAADEYATLIFKYCDSTRKIEVIKLIKSITGLGLKEAKELVDAGNKPIREDIPLAMAQSYAADLSAVGAIVEIRTSGGRAPIPPASQDEFTLVFVYCDSPSKIEVIKLIKSITGLGLKEAKELVDAGNKPILEDIPLAMAQSYAAELTAAGAVVKIHH